MQETKNKFVKKAINYFNNAFEQGEMGDELRDDDLGKKYAEAMWENLVSNLITLTEQRVREDERQRIFNEIENYKKQKEGNDLVILKRLMNYLKYVIRLSLKQE